jgi:tetratricopeptide (TPR) repeat protein
MKQLPVKNMFVIAVLWCFISCSSIDTDKKDAGVELSFEEAVARAVREIERVLEPGKRTAIAGFSAGTPELSGYLIDELTAGLVRGKKTTVVDRNNIAHIQKELNFNMSGYVSDETAQGIGKLVAARYIVSGSLSEEENGARFQVVVMRVEHTSPDFVYTANIRKDKQFESLVVGVQSGQIKPAPILDRADSFDNTDRIFGEGLAFFNRGEYDRAIENFTRVIAVLPSYASAYNNRGVAYIRKGSYRQGLADCNTSLSILPENPYIYSIIASAYLGMENADEAIAACDKGIAINSSYIGLYANRASAYAMKEELDKAMADCDRLIELFPDNADSYMVRGLVLYCLKDYDGAIQDWTKALELEPNHYNSEKIKQNIGAASYYKIFSPFSKE